MDESSAPQGRLVVILALLSLCLCEIVTELEDHLLCRRCGHEIAVAQNLKHIPSDLAKRQRNDTILGKDGVLIQLFQNPAGEHFEVITAKSADVLQHGKAYPEHSWFPGFAWRIAVCPQCGFHLGWTFESAQEGSHLYDEAELGHQHNYSFVGLIMSNIIHQTFAESLIFTPKAYNA